MKIKHLTVLFFLFLLIFNSCGPGVLVDRNKKIENAVWKSADIIKFSVSIPDTLQLYNIYINIRNSTDYKYSNIFLFLKTFYPNRMYSIDTIECLLADDSGKWLGKERGKMVDNRILFRRGIRFKLSGNYSFEFEQAMRDTDLNGIEDFGIRIEKSEAEK
ncbi:MAG TPA: gliding motility lipoprotein GldH [Bacteroidales bacterium]|nr:gliding motility lipoprotein GldH [Bacteroidales bacterium]